MDTVNKMRFKHGAAGEKIGRISKLFIAGLIIGFIAGVIVTVDYALCVANKRNDRRDDDEI